MFSASAPGSLMLLGEHGVLANYPAIASAINKRMHITLKPRSDNTIHLYTKAYGHYSTNLTQLTICAPYQFALATLSEFEKELAFGCDIVIESEFEDHLGLGSSAAVTVALIKILCTWLNISHTENDIWRKGLKIITRVQGMGSGTDLAASILGGVIALNPRDASITSFACTHDLVAIYLGHKTKTPDVIKKINMEFANAPQLLADIHQSIGTCVQYGIDALRENDWSLFAKFMTIQQNLMQALGVSSPFIDRLIMDLAQN